jgi:RimJ/RimL family protein N-acetyltransferase
MGETNLKGQGVSTEASKLILDYGFYELGLNRIYLFTETTNIPAQRLFEKVGFVKEGCIRQDIISHGEYVDRYTYGMCREEYIIRDRLSKN